jgi:anaerobic magnesium-protoporphyrin IX monomethyl ester cyclase
MVLIEPPFLRLFKPTYSLDRLPLGLAYLAGSIGKETKWDIKIYNGDFVGQSEQVRLSYLGGNGFANYLNNLEDTCGAVWREVKATIRSLAPHAVGITSKAQNFGSARVVARIAKEVDSNIFVIVGGPHPTLQPTEVLNDPHIDMSVFGEGEATIVDLLHALENGESLERVRGVAYRKNGTVFRNGHRDLLRDLDRLSFPHENLEHVLLDYDRYPTSAFKYVVATRGCPFNCLFCGSRYLWGRSVRFRSPENVVRELQSLWKKGLRLIHFSDDTFGVNRDYLKSMCKAIEANCPRLRWSCETHVSLVTRETVAAMKRAGCHSIEIGIESGNNAMLKRIRKGTTIEQAFAACDTIKQSGIEVVALFMVGLPDETEATLADTWRAMQRINCDRIHFSIFTPYPGTEAFELCRAQGLIGSTYDPSVYGHQSPENFFCKGISPDLFRRATAAIERMVDRRNFHGRLKGLFRPAGIQRMRESGPIKGLRNGIKFFMGM